MKKIRYIQTFTAFSLLLTAALGFSQEEELAELRQQAMIAAAEANNHVYEGNEKLSENDFVEAEAEYRKAMSKDIKNANAPYNLANAYYRNEKLTEAFDRYKQAASKATEKAERHKAFHNMGNVFMKNKEYEKAVEAFKNALRNDPNDEETRYNYALAKELLKKENDGGGGDDNNKDQDQDQNKDQKNQDKDKEEENEDKDGENEQDKENQDQNDQEGENDQDKQGEDEEDKGGDEKEDKKDENKGGDQPKDDQQQQPRPGQLSPQQVKNLLEAANNEENKVQDRINVQKAKGAKVKTEKDW